MNATTTLNDLFDLVVDDYKGKSSHTQTTLRNNLKHLRPLIGDKPASSVSTADVEQYKSSRLTAGAAVSTIDLELATLRRAFKLAVQASLGSSSTTIPTRRVTPHPELTFTDDNYKRMLDVLDYDYRFVLRFGRLTGWPLDEILALQWTSYDPQTHTIKTANRTLRVTDEKLIQWFNDDYDLFRRRELNCLFIYDGVKPITKAMFFREWRKAQHATGLVCSFSDLCPPVETPVYIEPTPSPSAEQPIEPPIEPTPVAVDELTAFERLINPLALASAPTPTSTLVTDAELAVLNKLLNRLGLRCVRL